MTTALLPDLSQDVLTAAVRKAAVPLRGADNDYDSLLDFIGDARFVLIGEASHGTHEFYRERAQITKRLIREKGFDAVAVEADWPDAYRVNRYVRGRGDDVEAIEALEGFKRFPTWMWRNADVLDFVGWLRNHNDSIRAGQSKIGFYGLDLYSLHASMEAVVAYLDKVDPEAAERARRRYACFDTYGEDAQAYGFAAGLHLGNTCENEVITQLVDLRKAAGTTHFAMADWRKTTISTPRRTPGWSETPSTTTARCIAARFPLGTSATATWRNRSSPWSASSAKQVRVPRSSFGPTTHTWAMLVPRKWARRASGTWANSRGSDMGESRY